MKIIQIAQKILISLVLLITAQNIAFAQNKEIAITIDDLPFVGDYRNFHLNMIINTLLEEKITATGFIIASEVRDNSWELLNKFRDSGFGLGNHTFSHANLNKIDTKAYLKEIKSADKILLPVMTKPKYFRYPYLAMANGAKREEVLCYLAKKDYQVAPITVDSKDFIFNQRLLSVIEADRRTYFEELKPFYLDFIWQQTLKAEEHNEINHRPDQAQILLIHANLLNAYVLPQIIQMYKEKGYTFISLEDALKTFKDTPHCGQEQVISQAKKPKPVKISKPIEVAQQKPQPAPVQLPVKTTPELQYNAHNENNIESFVEWN